MPKPRDLINRAADTRADKRVMRQIFNEAARKKMRALAGVLMIIVLTYVAIAAILPESMGGKIFRYSILLAAILLGAYLQHRMFRKVEREFRKGLLASGICRGCAYSLQSLPCDADGFTNCPECGASWILATHEN